MKKLMLPFLAAVILFISGCSSVSVTYDYDKSVDFTKLKTFEYYGWAKESDKILNSMDKQRIENAFGEEFKKRGMQLVEENGDLVVALFIVTEQKQETTATTTSMGGMYGGYGYGGYYGYGPGWGWGGGVAQTTYNTYDYTVGTLVCDVFHASDQKLIWEGIGQGTISDPQKREKSIPKAVSAIMAVYPVPPVKSK